MTIRQARGHAYRASPTPRSPTGQSLFQLAAYLQDEAMETLRDAKVVIPGAFPMLVSQQPQYLKPCAGPKVLTYSRREVPGRKHTCMLPHAKLCAMLLSNCAICPPPPHLGGWQEESSLLRNQKGQLSRVKWRRGLYSSVPSGCLTWAPTPARERTGQGLFQTQPVLPPRGPG